MWVTAAKIALALFPKDRIIFMVIAIPMGIMLLFMLFFGAPSGIYKHVPAGNDEQYNFYLQAADQIKTETGVEVNWQEIMAIDAVVFEQDFSRTSYVHAYGYKQYFIREERQETQCPPEPSPTGNGPKPSKAPEKPPKKCYKTVYYGRTFDQVLDMLVNRGIIRSNQKADVKDYTRFKLTYSPIGDSELDGIILEGDFTPELGIYAWPLPANATRITSPFAIRVHPVTGEVKQHLGIDIGVPNGTSVYAIADGTVEFVGESGTAGNMITISHANNVRSKYMHLQSFMVSSKQAVKKGDLIAFSGNTGRVTGPHLHFQMEVRNKAVNPLTFY